MNHIDDLLKQYRQLHDALTDEIDQVQTKLIEIRAPLDSLEGQIKSAVIAQAASAGGYGIKATYRRGYARISWNNKKLDGYAAAHPEILAFRTESQVKPGVSIKVQ